MRTISSNLRKRSNPFLTIQLLTLDALGCQMPKRPVLTEFFPKATRNLCPVGGWDCGLLSNQYRAHPTSETSFLDFSPFEPKHQSSTNKYLFEPKHQSSTNKYLFTCCSSLFGCCKLHSSLFFIPKISRFLIRAELIFIATGKQ